MKKLLEQGWFVFCVWLIGALPIGFLIYLFNDPFMTFMLGAMLVVYAINGYKYYKSTPKKWYLWEPDKKQVTIYLEGKRPVFFGSGNRKVGLHINPNQTLWIRDEKSNGSEVSSVRSNRVVHLDAGSFNVEVLEDGYKVSWSDDFEWTLMN